MRLIGVTGGIATGKTTVDRMLAAHGATVIDADELAREVVRPGEPALEEVATRFGRDVIQPDGSLDRTRLGRLVFADSEARRDLERITHPRITELMSERVAAALTGPVPLIAVDIPLLFENAREAMFEGVLLVYAPPEVQVKRLRERNGLDEAAALDARIVKFQLGGSESAGPATDSATLDRLIAGIRNSKAQVVVENGQLKAGGTIDAFSVLFEALEIRSHTLAMTFDTGNWRWAQQDPLEAARRRPAVLSRPLRRQKR